MRDKPDRVKGNGPIVTHHFELDDKDEMKPCPFCGGRSLELSNTHTPSYTVSCEDCSAEIHGEYGPDLVGGKYGSRRQHEAAAASAIAAWNNRT